MNNTLLSLRGQRIAAIAVVAVAAARQGSTEIPIYICSVGSAAQGFKYLNKYYIYLLFKLLLNKSCASFIAFLFALFVRYCVVSAVSQLR